MKTAFSSIKVMILRCAFYLDTFIYYFEVQQQIMQTITTENELLIEGLQIKKAALIYRAINHPLRNQMLQLLHKNQRMAVTELYVKLRLEQSVASQHLAILRKAGFVNTQRDGKKIFYSVNYARLSQVEQNARGLIGA